MITASRLPRRASIKRCPRCWQTFVEAAKPAVPITHDHQAFVAKVEGNEVAWSGEFAMMRDETP